MTTALSSVRSTRSSTRCADAAVGDAVVGEVRGADRMRRELDRDLGRVPAGELLALVAGGLHPDGGAGVDRPGGEPALRVGHDLVGARPDGDPAQRIARGGIEHAARDHARVAPRRTAGAAGAGEAPRERASPAPAWPASPARASRAAPRRASPASARHAGSRPTRARPRSASTGRASRGTGSWPRRRPPSSVRTTSVVQDNERGEYHGSFFDLRLFR